MPTSPLYLSFTFLSGSRLHSRIIYIYNEVVLVEKQVKGTGLVLYRVLYPKVHGNGFEKKKKKKGTGRPSDRCHVPKKNIFMPHSTHSFIVDVKPTFSITTISIWVEHIDRSLLRLPGHHGDRAHHRARSFESPAAR